MMGESCAYALEAKKSKFLVHLDRFSNLLNKYFKYFEKRSK